MTFRSILAPIRPVLLRKADDSITITVDGVTKSGHWRTIHGHKVLVTNDGKFMQPEKDGWRVSVAPWQHEEPVLNAIVKQKPGLLTTGAAVTGAISIREPLVYKGDPKDILRAIQANPPKSQADRKGAAYARDLAEGKPVPAGRLKDVVRYVPHAAIDPKLERELDPLTGQEVSARAARIRHEKYQQLSGLTDTQAARATASAAKEKAAAAKAALARQAATKKQADKNVKSLPAFGKLVDGAAENAVEGNPRLLSSKYRKPGVNDVKLLAALLHSGMVREASRGAVKGQLTVDSALARKYADDSDARPDVRLAAKVALTASGGLKKKNYSGHDIAESQWPITSAGYADKNSYVLANQLGEPIPLKLANKILVAGRQLAKLIEEHAAGTRPDVQALVTGQVGAKDVARGNVAAIKASSAEEQQKIRDACLAAQDNDKWKRPQKFTMSGFGPGAKEHGYQIKGVNWAITAKRGINCFGTGLGKSLTMVMTALKLNELGCDQGIIIAPVPVLDQMVTEAKKAAPTAKVVAISGDARQRAALLKKAASADIVMFGSSALLQPECTDYIKAHPKASMQCDECVPAGTLITTQQGDIPIEKLKCGDIVLGFNHETRITELTRVQHCFVRRTRSPLIEVSNTIMTYAHPVWTENRGYVEAGLVDQKDRLLKLETCDAIGGFVGTAYMRILRGFVAQQKKGRPVLQPSLLQPMEVKAAGNNGQTIQSGESSETCESVAYHEIETRCAGEIGGAFEFGKQPVSRCEKYRESQSSAQSVRLQDAKWWQWKRTIRAAENFGRSVGLADGAYCADRAQFATSTDALQTRYSAPEREDMRRGGRQFAQYTNSENQGCQEGPLSRLSRMARIACEKLRGAYGNAVCDREDSNTTVVYNIETGTSNYFANGLLVHNCHKYKRRGAGMTAALESAVGKRDYAIGYTATPTPNYDEDFFNLVDMMRPGTLGTKAQFAGKKGVEEIIASAREGARVNTSGLARMHETAKPFVFTKTRLDPDVKIHVPPNLDIDDPHKYPSEYTHFDHWAADFALRKELERASAKGRAPNIFAIMGHARTLQRQIAISPALIMKDYGEDTGKSHLKSVKDYSGPEPTVDAAVENALDHIGDKRKKGQPFIIASDFNGSLDRARHRLEQAGIPPADIMEYSGRTNVGAKGEDKGNVLRQLAKDRANDGKISVLLLNTVAGGTGLNLQGNKALGTGPSAMYVMNEPWRGVDHSQLVDRMNRQGQQRETTSWLGRMPGTITDRVHELVAGKNVVASVLSHGETGATRDLEKKIGDLSLSDQMKLINAPPGWKEKVLAEYEKTKEQHRRAKLGE